MYIDKEKREMTGSRQRDEGREGGRERKEEISTVKKGGRGGVD